MLSSQIVSILRVIGRWKEVTHQNGPAPRPVRLVLLVSDFAGFEIRIRRRRLLLDAVLLRTNTSDRRPARLARPFLAFAFRLPLPLLLAQGDFGCREFLASRRLALAPARARARLGVRVLWLESFATACRSAGTVDGRDTRAASAAPFRRGRERASRFCRSSSARAVTDLVLLLRCGSGRRNGFALALPHRR